MPSINWAEVRANKLGSLKTVLISSYRSILAVLRIFAQRDLSFRNGIARAWLGTAFTYVPTVLYSEPPGHNAQHVQGEGFEAYIVPTTPENQLRAADAIVLFAHGGGMVMGHPLQYLKEYERWSNHARRLDKKVVFVAPRYPLSTSAKWPAQRDAMLATYHWIMAQGVSANKISIAGDSAGGNLAVLTTLRLRDMQAPLPSCLVLMSAWLDMSAKMTLNSPYVRSDFMLGYDQGAAVMNEMLRPIGTSPETPEISALLWEDVSGLPPQLVFYSTTEQLGSDSERWIERCKKAGNQVTPFVRRGEMHTFAVGWPVCGGKMQALCDEAICNFILRHVE